MCQSQKDGVTQMGIRCDFTLSYKLIQCFSDNFYDDHLPSSPASFSAVDNSSELLGTSSRPSSPVKSLLLGLVSFLVLDSVLLRLESDRRRD